MRLHLVNVESADDQPDVNEDTISQDDSEDAFTEDEDVVQANLCHASSRSSASDSEDEDLGLLKLNSVFFKTLTSRTSYTCRFKNDCLQVTLDSGATKNITGTLDYLRKQRQLNASTVKTAFGQQSTAKITGTLTVMLLNNAEFSVPNVLYCPDVQSTILSTQQFIKDGYTVHIDTSGAKVKWEGHTFLSASFTNGSYVVHCTQQYTRTQAVKLHKTGVRSL